MAIDNVQAVLSKQIGTNKCDIVISTTAMTGKDYYCIHFPVESVYSFYSSNKCYNGYWFCNSKSSYYNVPAGTTLFLNITDITLTSGVAICYYTQAQ
jgi:hypothetical protein